MTVTGGRWPRAYRARERGPGDDRAYDEPLQERAGFRVISGNLFDFAIIKTSVISDDFREVSERR